jgi:hypothetical protein
MRRVSGYTISTFVTTCTDPTLFNVVGLCVPSCPIGSVSDESSNCIAISSNAPYFIVDDSNNVSVQPTCDGNVFINTITNQLLCTQGCPDGVSTPFTCV